MSKYEKTGNEFLTDAELLNEIKHQQSEFNHWQWELSQIPESEAATPANEYMASDWEQHIDSLIQEAKKRGLELPGRESEK
jgi:hypothetical protein